MSSLVGAILALAILALVIWVSIVLPFKMARKRNRNAWGWLLVSILVSPIIAIAVLAALGPAQDTTDISETFA